MVDRLGVLLSCLFVGCVWVVGCLGGGGIIVKYTFCFSVKIECCVGGFP